VPVEDGPAEEYSDTISVMPVEEDGPVEEYSDTVSYRRLRDGVAGDVGDAGEADVAGAINLAPWI
jgi:hypothetical protein